MNKYKLIDEMLESFNKNKSLWDKIILHPKMNWLRWIIYNLKDLPKDIYNNIKWFIQRGKRGYADCDVWDFDSYLSKVISEGIKDLKSQIHGVSSDFASKDGKDIYLDKWKVVLDEIIWTFETSQKIIDADWIYLNSKERNKKRRIKFSKEFNYHIMTKEECDRYRKGWVLFRKYYHSLWD